MWLRMFKVATILIGCTRPGPTVMLSIMIRGLWLGLYWDVSFNCWNSDCASSPQVSKRKNRKRRTWKFIQPVEQSWLAIAIRVATATFSVQDWAAPAIHKDSRPKCIGRTTLSYRYLYPCRMVCVSQLGLFIQFWFWLFFLFSQVKSLKSKVSWAYYC